MISISMPNVIAIAVSYTFEFFAIFNYTCICITNPVVLVTIILELKIIIISKFVEARVYS